MDALLKLIIVTSWFSATRAICSHAREVISANVCRTYQVTGTEVFLDGEHVPRLQSNLTCICRIHVNSSNATLNVSYIRVSPGNSACGVTFNVVNLTYTCNSTEGVETTIEVGDTRAVDVQYMKAVGDINPIACVRLSTAENVTIKANCFTSGGISVTPTTGGNSVTPTTGGSGVTITNSERTTYEQVAERVTDESVSNTGVIAGSVAGGVVVIILMIVAIIFWRLKCRKRSAEEDDYDPPEMTDNILYNIDLTGGYSVQRVPDNKQVPTTQDGMEYACTKDYSVMCAVVNKIKGSNQNTTDHAAISGISRTADSTDHPDTNTYYQADVYNVPIGVEDTHDQNEITPGAIADSVGGSIAYDDIDDDGNAYSTIGSGANEMKDDS